MEQRNNLLSDTNLNFIYSELINKNKKNDEQFINKKEDIIILSLHTIFLALGFKNKAKGNSDEADKYSMSDIWNKDEFYNFEYLHPQSKLNFIVKSLIMSNRLLIHGSTLEENEIYSLEVITDEYISDQTSFPLKKDDNLSNLYISQDKLNNLTQLIKEKVIQKLIPGLQKEGYQENITGGNDATSNITPPIHDNYNDSSRNVNLTEPSFNPFAYGDRDLNPLGGMGTAPGLPRFGGGGGSSIDPFGMGGSSQGGMFLGPNHPIFSPDHPSAPRNPGSLPPHAIPPGARFDPITPLGPRVNPNSQREQRPTFSGEPDNDELPPPGYNNMFM